MTHSEDLFRDAQTYFVGGVNSPVRSFRAVGGTPRFIRKAKGCRLWDEDGKAYIDYVGSWGPAILGHTHPQVVEAVRCAAENGLSFGAPTEAENRLAELIQQAFPAMQLLRFVNSGTEATMSALRLARGFTQRGKILKFDGCYHGHSDSLLVRAGSGALSVGEPDSAGVPHDFAKHTLIASYNDLASVDRLLEAHGHELAAIIVEPIAGNMGCVPPKRGFLEGVQERCRHYGALLIFDEVMSGFRVAKGGAQELYKMVPDLTCLGKIVGGGLPVGAYGGKREIMEKLSPLGPVYQAGTLSGNPIAMAAGIATLQILFQENPYPFLEERGQQLEKGIREIAREKKCAVEVNRVGSMWTIFFNRSAVFDLQSAMQSDSAQFSAFFHALLENEIYIAPSPYESCFISTAHRKEDIETTVAAIRRALP